MADIYVSLGTENSRGSLPSETNKIINGQLSIGLSNKRSGVRTQGILLNEDEYDNWYLTNDSLQDARVYLDISSSTRIPINSYFSDYSHFASCIEIKNNNTQKAYILGSSSTDTTPIYDASIYLTTTAGELSLSQIQITSEANSKRMIYGSLRGAGMKYDYASNECLIISSGSYSYSSMQFFTSNRLKLNDNVGQWNATDTGTAPIPDLHIKDGCVAINYNWLTTTPNYNLYVNGTSYFSDTVTFNNFARFVKLTEKSVTDNTTNVYRNSLILHGTAYGNNEAHIQNKDKLTYGDPGPQIIFTTGGFDLASGDQIMSLIYSDHNDVGDGNSLHLVSNQGTSWFKAYNIQAQNALYVGQSRFLDTGTSSTGKVSTPSYLAINKTDAPSYALDVHGSAYIYNRLILGNSDSVAYGTDLPDTGVVGQVFFKLI